VSDEGREALQAYVRDLAEYEDGWEGEVKKSRKKFER
jgi:hypothetical protein